MLKLGNYTVKQDWPIRLNFASATVRNGATVKIVQNDPIRNKALVDFGSFIDWIAYADVERNLNHICQ